MDKTSAFEKDALSDPVHAPVFQRGGQLHRRFKGQDGVGMGAQGLHGRRHPAIRRLAVAEQAIIELVVLVREKDRRLAPV